MNLLGLAKAQAAIEPNHSILIYGPPKGGKSKLVGTAAKIKEIRRIWWFDGENGVETLLHMGLTDEELAKVTVFKIRDTKDEPIFIETVLKSFTTKAGVSICDVHGRVDCAVCKKASNPFTRFCMSECGHNDLVVTDSGSALGDSAMAALCLGKDSMFKPGWDEYGIQGKWLGDILSVIQQAVHTNFVVITHEMCIENDEKKDVFYPLMGTKPFSMKCAKYFGTVVYVHKKLNKHVAGSSSTYLGDRVTGSRVNAVIEKAADASMRTILIEGGIIREGSFAGDAKVIDMGVAKEKSNEVLATRESLDTAKVAAAENKEKKLSFAERMAAAKKQA